MEVHVKTSVGISLCLTVRGKDSLSFLKERIAHFHSVPIERQMLFFENTPLLDADATLEQLGLK